MAFITAETRSDLIELSVAMLKQAPSNTLLEELIALSVGGGSLADAADHIAKTDAFKAEYPSFQTAEQYAAEIFDNITTGGTVTADIRTAVIELATGMLTSGSVTKAGLALAIAEYLAAPAALLNTDFADIAQSFQNRADAAEYFVVTKELGGSTDAELAAAIASVTSDAATLTAANTAADATAAAEEVVPGQTFTLTTGVNNGSAFTGGTADDTFVATAATAATTTLTPGDVLTGGEGTDTLSITASTAGGNTLGAGVTTASVESFSVNSVTATTLDATLMTGVTDLYNNGSLASLSVSNLSAIPNVHLVGTSADTTVAMTAATTVGTADAMTVAMSSAATSTDANLTAQGIETFNVLASVASGSATTSQTLTSTSARSVAITGDASTSITVDLAGAGATEALTGSVTGNAAANTMNVTADVADFLTVDLGAGNDILILPNGLGENYTVAGGEGVNVLGLTQAGATATDADATISDFDVLNIIDAGTGTIDMDDFEGGFTKVIYDAGLGGAATVDDAVTGIEVEVDVTAVAQNLTVDLKTDGAADAITVTIDAIGAGDAIGTIDASDAETLTISVDDDTTTATGTIAIAGITLGDATSVVLSGDAATTITTFTNPTTAVLTSFDASGMTDALTMSGLNLAAAGATITLGSGDDSVTMGTGDGADTIDLTAGGDNTIVYTAVGQSDAAAMDVITGFVSGSDDIDLTALGVTTSTLFGGVAATKTAAEGLLAGATAPIAVFQADDNVLWVDDGDNLLNAADFRIQLDGVSTIAATDLGLRGAGVALSITAASATTATTGAVTNASANTTNEADTITSAIASLTGSTITGGGGTDNLVLSDVGAVGALPGTITQVETLTLADGTNTGIAFNAAGVFENVTGGSGSDTIADTANLDAGGVISLGAGDDVITDLSADLAASTINMGAGNDSLTSTVGGAITATLVGGDGTSDLLSLANTDDISGATVSGFEDLTIATNGSIVTTFAQIAALVGGTVTAAGAETVTPAASAGGSITAAAALETYDFSNVTSAVTIDASATADFTITGSGSADTVALGAAGSAADTVDTGAGDDTVTATGALTTDAGYTNMETFELTFATAATFTTGALATGEPVTIDASASTAAATIAAGDYNGVTTAAADLLTITDGAGNDIITIPDTAVDRAGTTVNLTTGGSDTVATGTLEAVDLLEDAATINGFTPGNVAGADSLNVTFASGGDVAGYVFASALGTSVGTAEEVVVVISTAIGAVADLTDDADGGTVEAQIIAALDLTNLATDGDDIIVLLSNFAGTSTGVYNVDVTTAATEVIAVEHIVTLVGVDVDAITTANII